MMPQATSLGRCITSAALVNNVEPAAQCHCMPLPLDQLCRQGCNFTFHAPYPHCTSQESCQPSCPFSSNCYCYCYYYYCYCYCYCYCCCCCYCYCYCYCYYYYYYCYCSAAAAATTTTRKAVVATQLVEWNILLTQHESHESSVAEPSQSQHALAPQDPSGRGTCTSQGTL